MKNSDLISVIVPIYNVEHYLRKCIDSIINQTYRNLEIILVDDGSTDNCFSICTEYKMKDRRIIVIHKTNGGLSSARNAGLTIATGNLISFVDSDDYLELSFYEQLINNMNKYASDIAICSFYNNKGNRKKQLEINSNKEFYISNDKEKFKTLHGDIGNLIPYSWNKLYKKELFENVRYPEGKIYEDSYIICNLLEKANRVSFIIEPLYNYVYRDNSIIHSFSIKHFDKIDSFNRKIDFLNTKAYYDLAIEEKNRKSIIITQNLYKMNLYKIDNEEIYNKYYQELLSTTKELKWKESSNKVRLFKIFKKHYIKWNYLERKVYYFLKKSYNTIKLKLSSLL